VVKQQATTATQQATTATTQATTATTQASLATSQATTATTQAGLTETSRAKSNDDFAAKSNAGTVASRASPPRALRFKFKKELTMDRTRLLQVQF
jgi:predicted glutamine amidotransferase